MPFVSPPSGIYHFIWLWLFCLCPLFLLPQTYVTLADFGYSVYALCFSSLRHISLYLTLVILFMPFVSPPSGICHFSWLWLFCVCPLFLLPQAYVTLADFGYSVYALCFSSLRRHFSWLWLLCLCPLFLLPQTYATLADFGYSVYALCFPSLRHMSL